MQLDLFLDNRRTILENAADEHLRNLNLKQAIALYEQIRTQAPDDPTVSSAKSAMEAWRQRLDQFHSSTSGIGRIHRLYGHLSNPAPAALLKGVHSFIIDQLLMEESPELIFVPPRFHIGRILLDAGLPVEAEKWFFLALDSGIAERGRFLAWLGDALAVAGDNESARECYLAAFLEDPLGVDVSGLRDDAVRALLVELEEEGIAEEDTVHWVPVWGWLKGLFGLETSQIFSGEISQSRQWFECLGQAERLRTEVRDDTELLRVRRKMKELSPLLFTRYMEKISG